MEVVLAHEPWHAGIWTVLLIQVLMAQAERHVRVEIRRIPPTIAKALQGVRVGVVLLIKRSYTGARPFEGLENPNI